MKTNIPASGPIMRDGTAADPEKFGEISWGNAIPWQPGKVTEIQAKVKTAPLITPAAIEANIVSEHYFTAEDGVMGAAIDHDGCITSGKALNIPDPLELLTFCVLVLRNGFTVTGESACVSPENFDSAEGRKWAREKAIDKIWPLLGYALKDKLFQRTQPVQSPDESHIRVQILTGKHPAQPLDDGDFGIAT